MGENVVVDKTSAIILNWNTSEIVNKSIENLRVDGVSEIIVVDNGSNEEFDKPTFAMSWVAGLNSEVTYLPYITYVKLNKNLGYSYGKNLGIELTSKDYVFSLNGDILYVPGTIEAYGKVLDRFPDAANVGMFDAGYKRSYGSLGVKDYNLSDKQMPKEFKITDHIPVSWIHYGLYRGDVLRKNRLPVNPPFDKPGYGYEDDWHYYKLKNAGYNCLAINGPVYYHLGSVSKKNLSDVDEISNLRKEAFQNYWNIRPWYELLQLGAIMYNERSLE